MCCIKIIDSDSETNYQIGVPLEEQIHDSQKVVIDYDPKDEAIDYFLLDMKRLCNTGINADFKVDVIPNNCLNGMKVKKQLKRLTKDLHLNEVIKLLTLLQSKTDKVLEELSGFCNK
jgi:sugar-specific transcriptional regulator TrmB